MRYALFLPLPLLLLPATLGGQELEPWKSNRHPSDVSRRHVQEMTTGLAEYQVVQGGTMDGRNCRSPQGVWTPCEQTWESNRWVRMENVGDTDVVNPWLSNGQNDFRTVDAIVARAVEPGMTEKEKAFALWWQQLQFRFHYQGDNSELTSPVKLFNVYGHNTCGNDSICLAGLWKTAGLKVAPARLVGHCVTQVFYDDAWHLFDGDMQSVYLLRDNETVASEQELVRDHDLITRTHTQGILRPQGRAGDVWESSIYVYEGAIAGDRNADRASAMNMTLRPGEALVWRWGHTEPPKYFGMGGGTAAHKFPERICNGLWEYRPDFSRSTWQRGADLVQDIRAMDGVLTPEPGKTGIIAWTIQSPYVLVGGRLEIEGKDPQLDLSWDGERWQPVGKDLDGLFPPVGTARYGYRLRCRLEQGASLRGLRIVNDVQMAPLSLPEMAVGVNRFAYSDESPGERRVRITHEWVERSASTPPSPPESPLRPIDGGNAEGTAVAFEWPAAVDPDGDRIADYHFELSAREDMKWPLSMSFAKLISRTDDAGSTRYTLKAAGELNPDRTYFWRVRAKDEHGVWGAWSQTWRFTPRGPAIPLEVRVESDRRRGVEILRWKPNPQGRQPVRYRVYASDEKGFTASDESSTVAAGLFDFRSQSVTKGPTELPASFATETDVTELAVAGAGSRFANKAFYRVVAVDESGNLSGPSDYATAPRPLIRSEPPTAARIGQPYQYDVSIIRSIGDVRTRVVEGREVMNFWDIEQPRFQLLEGPEWLQIDGNTGRLSGVPEAAGEFSVVLSVELQREVRELDPAQLQWGIEKVLRTRSETIGTAQQTFTIKVAP